MILLIASGLRFHKLGEQSLWHDEGNSYVQSTRTFFDIAENASHDIHPPGYYWSLAIWRLVAGQTEFALRVLSAFVSIMTVALSYAIGRQLFGTLAGGAASVIVALNTFSIFYAQEARMYALLAMWGVASMWVFVLLIHNATQKVQQSTLVIVLGVINAAGLYTQYAFSFVMLAQGVLLFVWLMMQKANRSTTFIYYIAANLLTIVLYLPWLPTAWRQLTNWPITGQEIAFSEAMPTIIAYLTFGITVGMGITTAAAFFLAFGLLQPVQNTRRGAFKQWAVLLPVIWVAIAVGIFLGRGLFREANLKFLLPAQVGLALWLGHGVSALWFVQPQSTSWLIRQIPKLASLAGMIVLLATFIDSLPSLYNDPVYQRDDYRSIVDLIKIQAQPGDAVILSAPNQWEIFTYYYKGAMPIYPLPRGLGGDNKATWTEVRQIIDEHRIIYALLWAIGERDPDNIVQNTLNTYAFEIDSKWYGDVRLVRYTTPIKIALLNEIVNNKKAVTFGDFDTDSIVLKHAGMSAEAVQPGDVLQIQLQWGVDQSINTRYKVFMHLLDPDGFLVAQRDAEPGGGTQPTTSWQVNKIITDNHALIVPNDLVPAHYSLILGLYNLDDPQARLPVANLDYYTLAHITVLPRNHEGEGE